jgi:hypothetical protein
VRQIDITEECLAFVDQQGERVALKFFQLIEVMTEIKVVNSNFVKKLQTAQFYELRIKSGNEYSIVIFAIDHLNFTECTKAICLFGFQKKSTKDYKKAIKTAEKILAQYLNK